MAGSFLWTSHHERNDDQRLAWSVARAVFGQIIATREWVASHGGVYVPPSESTPPNPYLKDPDRDVVTKDGRRFTKINPAYMTRQLSELAWKSGGIRFHLTSLNPIRPGNAPTPWERGALESFELGEKEAGTYEGDDFAYMAPLPVESPCIRCHADQGYQVGDVRGGLLIVLPGMAPRFPFSIALGHLFIGLTGAALLLFLGGKLGRAYEDLRLQATVDPLTEVRNRRHFFEQFDKELRRARRGGASLAFLLFDVDYFKQFNDLYGHLAGDDCLRTVAQTLQSRLRRGGDLFARYGGEEFVALLPDTDAEGARRLAEELREAVLELRIPHATSPVVPWVSLSIGVSLFDPASEATVDTVIQAADTALYRAKSGGRNRVEFPS